LRSKLALMDKHDDHIIKGIEMAFVPPPPPSNLGDCWLHRIEKATKKLPRHE
jgi:hypothetical protein